MNFIEDMKKNNVLNTRSVKLDDWILEVLYVICCERRLIFNSADEPDCHSAFQDFLRSKPIIDSFVGVCFFRFNKIKAMLFIVCDCRW